MLAAAGELAAAGVAPLARIAAMISEVPFGLAPAAAGVAATGAGAAGVEAAGAAPLARMAAMMSEVPFGLAAGATASTAAGVTSAAAVAGASGAGVGTEAPSAGFLRSIAIMSAVDGFLSVMMVRRHDDGLTGNTVTDQHGVSRTASGLNRVRPMHENPDGTVRVCEYREDHGSCLTVRQLHPNRAGEILTLKKPIRLESGSHGVYDYHLLYAHPGSGVPTLLDFPPARGQSHETRAFFPEFRLAHSLS